MATLTKAQIAERDSAREQLRSMVKPGDTVSTILRHVSKSGMTRSISLVICQNGEPWDITWLAAKADGGKVDQNNGGIRIGGCGMDMGFALVYNLSYALYPTYHCVGKDTNGRRRCPSNTHVNPGDDRDNFSPKVVHDDGYAIGHRWL